MTTLIPITVAMGDGIGPEIMQATLKILEAAEAPIAPEIIELGEKAYLDGFTSGIPSSAWESIKRTKVLLKAPITTPQGKGYKSLNVTIRKSLGLFANVRPCCALYPVVETHHPLLDLVVVRENEEDLYTGIEYRQTQESYQCLKLYTRSGCERIIRFAFEYAKQFGRKKVTCMSKDNIMKMTDGLFHKTFNEIAAEYGDIENEHYIIDIGTAVLATQPEKFDVIVTSNLYGDIISDITAQLVGSVGLAGSSNIGQNYAMFEAIHGSAPDIAGKKIANPSGLISGVVLMLVHLGLTEQARLIENAWLTTIEKGIHTSDIYSTKHSEKCVNTDEFADAVIEHLGQSPKHFKATEYTSSTLKIADCKPLVKSEKTMIGVDVYLDIENKCMDELAAKLSDISETMKLSLISSRGVILWPEKLLNVTPADLCRCRFEVKTEGTSVTHQDIIALLVKLTELELDFVKTETLCQFDNTIGYSAIQGQ